MNALLLITLPQLFARYQCINIRQGLTNTISSSFDVTDHLQISPLYETDVSTFKYKAQQHYQNIPIFGASSVFEHQSPNTKNPKPIFGKYYNKNHIQSNLQNTIPTISYSEALNITLNQLNILPNTLYGYHSIKLYIYYHHSIPYLTYIIKFTYIKNNIQYQPMIILDANTGIIYKQYNNIKKFIDICGVGGNPKIGRISYCGNTALKVNAQSSQNIAPFLANHYVQIYDNNNTEFMDRSQAELMQCTLNTTSNQYYISDRIINNGYCVGCDVFEFINFIFNMYNQYIGVLPIKDEHIPLKAYIHVGNQWDSSYYDDIHGAVNFGDGNSNSRYPLGVIDIVGHEIGHGFTAKASDLLNSDESGGIDNAYSDLIGEMAEYFYYGSNDWRIGVNSYIASNIADRYMDEPTLDGVSIDNYNQYFDGMNPYYSSGIYSKAIYLLNTLYNWDMIDIFKIFTKANQLYWTVDITFGDGVCALYESLNDFYGTNSTKILKLTSDISNAFNTVGVQCQRNQTVSLCGNNKNTWCVYKEIIPSLTIDQVFTTYIQLERNDNNIGTNVTVFLTIRQNECKSPVFSFEYEDIDLDNAWEWMLVRDYEGNVIEKCGSEWQCGQFNDTCIKDYKLGLAGINADNTITFTINVDSEVGALCLHDYVLNARVKLKCYANTPAPTVPQPTSSPNTLAPTIPTIDPTVATSNPTPFPTHTITDCGNDTHCYHIDITPDVNINTESIVKIQNIDENKDVNYQILFNILTTDCIDPTITFTYELIDYDLRSEYLNVTDNDGKHIQTCQGGWDCGQWYTCLFATRLRSKIDAGTIYSITITESQQVDAICFGHDWSINAKLTLKCFAGTSDPTISPTSEPTLGPTIPTFQPPSFSPTPLTSNPTPQPTDYFYCDGTRDTLCYNINVTPQPNVGTAFVANVQHGVTNYDSYYRVFFNVKERKCVNPTLTFRYEQIDYDGINEYLDVYNNYGVLIDRCGNETGNFSCNTFDDCLTDYNLNENFIADNTTYEIKIFKPTDVDAQCTDTHNYAINAEITLICGSSSANPTFEPTLHPSSSPTITTDTPTQRPTYIKTTCGENTYCLHADINPLSNQDTEWEILIENTNNTQGTDFKVWVTPYQEDCVLPSVTFEFERIDYNSRDEYLLIYGFDGGIEVLNAQCGGDGVNNVCGKYDICLNNTGLGVNRIVENDKYIFYISQTAQVEPECDGSDMTMNARLTVTCKGMTSAPTIDPTKEPTTTPTLPTLTPSSNPTRFPTLPTNSPTTAPTHNRTRCPYAEPDEIRWCIYEDIYPIKNETSSFDIIIQNIDEGDTYAYDVYFRPKIFPCITPYITFIYEPIDYDQDNEYLNVTDKNGKLIAKCQGQAFECGTFAHCLPNYYIGQQIIKVGANDMISISQSRDVGSLCFDHDWSLNSKLTITCHNDRTDSLAPTQIPTPEPTDIPTINTLSPSVAPTMGPTVPTINPTLSPTHEIIPCPSGFTPRSICFSVDLYPDLDTPTTYDVPIVHDDVNAELQFYIIFNVANQIECVLPDISFNFELIDYDLATEYINITNNENKELQKCGAVPFGQDCGRFIDCFVNRPVGTNKIGFPPEEYKIGINVGADVDSLCDNHLYVINSVLTLRCSAGSAAPTTDPTTAKPTMVTSNPSATPSETPTGISSAPTPKPTFDVLCDPITNTWCYDVEISPLFIADTIWTVPLQYDDSLTTHDSVTLKIKYHISGMSDNDCVEPTISLIYETIDYDAAFEWMNVSEPGRIISECGMNNPRAECNVFATCFENYKLSPNKILKDTDYELTVYQPSDVDSLCSSFNNPFSINATLILKCFGGTANPSVKPTDAPTNSPTISTSAPTTSSPTDISISPTPSPTYMTTDCTPQTGALYQKYCIYVDMNPNNNIRTVYTAEIQAQQPMMIGDTKFDILFHSNGGDCINPQITFIYEKIDYDEFDEYINISDNKNGLITQCGGNGQNSCGQYTMCLNQTSLKNKVKIGNNEEYKISISVSTEVDALCFNHDYIIDAKITMICNIGTAFPSQSPTYEPTQQPTEITNKPTQKPTQQPTLPTLLPTPSPTVQRYKCKDLPITWCYIIDIYPIENEIMEHIFWIQGLDDNTETHFAVTFIPMYTNCINPTITIEYENIDFDGPGEYFEIFDNNQKLIQKCGGFYKCNTFSNCIKNYELNETLSAGTNYTITIIEQTEVDGLCSDISGHSYSMNAKVIFKCNNKQSEIINPPNGKLCNANSKENKYCYNKLIYPKSVASTIWTQEIYHFNDEIKTEFEITFESINERCYSPEIQFIYEQIDFDDFDEYISIFDNNTIEIAKCGSNNPENKCGSFDICFDENGYNLGIEYIDMSDIYKILLSESSGVDAMCNNHSFSINSKLSLKCNIRPSIVTYNNSNIIIYGSQNGKETIKETTINSQLNNNFQHNQQRFDVQYNIYKYDCLKPRITITTQIKTNSLFAQELTIYDENNNQTGRCVSQQQTINLCPHTMKCLNNYYLPNNILTIGQTYKFTMYQKINIDLQNDKWCGENKNNIITRLSFYCNGLQTNSPTNEPTISPTNNPITNQPTHYPITPGTKRPSQSQSQSQSPTQIINIIQTTQINNNSNNNNMGNKGMKSMNKNTLTIIGIIVIVIIAFCCVILFAIWYKRNKKNKGKVEWSTMTEMQQQHESDRLTIIPTVDGSEGMAKNPLTIPTTGGYDQTPLNLEAIGESDDEIIEYGKKSKKKKKRRKKNKKYATVGMSSPSGATPHDGLNVDDETNALVKKSS